MSSNDELWHFARTEEAQKIVSSMKQGLMDRMTIYTPRQRGKTTFLQKDLIPLAQKEQFLCIYVDFWLDMDNPVKAFCNGVRTSLDTYYGALGSMLKSTKNKTELNLGVFKFSAESGANTPEALGKLHEVFEELNKLDVKMLLLLDEVQQLGVDDAHLPFAAALRSFMNNRPDSKVFAIFTGSNREALSRMFGDYNMPFYQSSQEMPFPPLDKKFVQFEIGVYETLSKNPIDVEQAYEVFLSQQSMPKRFIVLLQKMILNRILDIRTAVDLYDTPIPLDNQRSFSQTVKKLKPIDTILLSMIAGGKSENLYSAETLEYIARTLNDKTIRKGVVQNAINRLKKDNHIFLVEKGRYAFSDHEFKEFFNRTILTGPKHTRDDIDYPDPQSAIEQKQSGSDFARGTLLKIEEKLADKVAHYDNSSTLLKEIISLSSTFINFSADKMTAKGTLVQLLVEKPELLSVDEIQELIKVEANHGPDST